VNGTTTRFVWAGGLLMAQNDGTNAFAWSYDGSGTMVGFTRNGTPYFYIRNLQGDVVGIYDANGDIQAQYAYDAWGNVLAETGALAEINPIRYRGYYYDSEINLYYLQSRYYNSAWGRFISADVYMDTQDGILGTNMYAYCQNDCVNLVDPTGAKLGKSEIHNAVQEHIRRSDSFMYATEKWVAWTIAGGVDQNGNPVTQSGLGRIDLIRYDTGEIWEVLIRTKTLDY
jgi:RHS repeat-associated protein